LGNIESEAVCRYISRIRNFVGTARMMTVSIEPILPAILAEATPVPKNTGFVTIFTPA